jgi:hypothetical protein
MSDQTYPQRLWNPTRDRTCPTGQRYPSAVGFVSQDPTARTLEPDQGRIYPMHQICSTWVGYIQPGTSAKALEPDGNI